MDWEKLFMTWGPAAPVMILLGKLFWDLVYKTIPLGFRQIRRAILTLEQNAAIRHEEHMAAMKRIDVELHAQAAVIKAERKPRPRSARKPRPV